MSSSNNDVSQWLVDSALFIDEKQINKLHEAIVKPEFELVSIAEGNSESAKTTVENRWKIDAEAGGTLLEIVKAKLKVGYQRKSKNENGESKSATENFVPINSPERKLEELTSLYQLGNDIGTEHKLVYDKFEISNTKAPQWYTDYSSKVPTPKPLCFFELPPKTCLIPTAAEFEDGTVATLFSDLRDALTTDNGRPNDRYPEPKSGQSDEELLQKRKEYWDSYTKYYSATKAMLCIEAAAKEHGKIKWIDFRLPITSTGETLHLHIVPNEEYYTGTFAYNFVKRFYKHGGKLVGILKAEPDLNVLAIYEN
jgi:hypothetical protein